MEDIPQLKEINGIDLSNYVRDPNLWNPVVYIHKRNLKRCMDDVEDKPPMHNKGQQFNYEDLNDSYNINVINEVNDPTAERTIHFAKTLIPLTIPPKSKNDVYYTVKSTKKSRTENKGCKCNLDNVTYEKLQTTKKEKVRSKKVTSKPKQYVRTSETTTQSSENTIPNSDDTHNHSLSELSEFSENKLKELTKRDTTKYIPSKSFEALAEEYTGCGEIKIQIMNDKEKQIFSQSICTLPVNAVKDSIFDEFNKGLSVVSNKIDKFADKLENVLERLNKIEEKLSKGAVNENLVENIRVTSANEKENTVERDSIIDDNSIREPKKRQKRSDILTIDDVEKEDEGRGERVPESFKPSPSYVGISPAPIHRLPARFCWTDSKIN